MRLICTVAKENREENPLEFSYYLTSQGIQNSVESLPDGSARIWIYNEDDVQQAMGLYEGYQKNPHDPRYRAHPHHIEEKEPELTARARKNRFLSPAPYGPVSVAILFVVIALFIWAQIQQGVQLPPKIPGIVQAPILPPVEKALLYDYPNYFEERDQLLTIYTPEEIKSNKQPSPEAKALILKLRNMPVWMGIYDRFILAIRQTHYSLAYHGPLFEKISQGEAWRLFTPALLHFDLLHIFFNVLWFILLGNQIEFRIGSFRYLALILAAAIVSNTAQYLMSGPFFMGLSGIVVAMAGFIWARQQVAPWEGYLLQRFTLIFLAIFILGMFVLQLVFFVLQLIGKFELTIGIANTAHLAGGMLGYLLGRMRFFAINK